MHYVGMDIDKTSLLTHIVVVQRICQSKCSAILSVLLNQNRFEISLSMDDSVESYDKCVVLIVLRLLVL